MANRSTYNIATPKNEVHVLTARLLGAAGAAVTENDPTPYASEIKTISRTGVGAHTFTLRHRYGELLAVAGAEVVGISGEGTVDLKAKVFDVDPHAGTVKVQTRVGAAATDLAATEELHLTLVMRNTKRG